MLQLPSLTETLQVVGSMANLNEDRKNDVHQRHSGQRAGSGSTARRDLHPFQNRPSAPRRMQRAKEAEVQDGSSSSSESTQGNNYNGVTRMQNASMERDDSQDHRAQRVESSTLPQASRSKQGRAPAPTRRVADVPSLRMRGDIAAAASTGADWPPANWGELGGACVPPLSARSRDALVHGRAVLL
jgi:hypothetical protein